MSRLGINRPNLERQRLVPYLVAIAICCLLAILGVGVVTLFLSREAAVVIEVVPIGEEDSLRVQVEGAVPQPGVYDLPPGSTIFDAIEAAGGPASDAATDQLDGETLLQDGAFLLVPRVDDSGSSEPIDINQASATELETLPGIGPVLAERIIQHREVNGPFTTLEELTSITGISERMVDELRDFITVVPE